MKNEFGTSARMFMISACMQRDRLLRSNKSKNPDPKLYDKSKQMQIDLLGIYSDKSVAAYLLKNYDTVYSIMPKNSSKDIRIQRLRQLKEQAIRINLHLVEAIS